MSKRYLIIQDTRSVSDIVESAVSNIVEGNIDPMQAYAVLTTFELAIVKIKDNKQVRDICLRELSKYGKVFIATEDGSVGTKGNVMDAIKANDIKADVIYACGPTPMLKAIKNYAIETGTEAWISMEEKMA